MKFFVYLLECSDGSYYCGCTKNIFARLAAHNKGTASRYTCSRRPVKLAYFERRKTLPAAMRREREIKRLTRKAKTALIKTEK